MTTSNLYELKARSRLLKPVIQVGKFGITNNVVEEVRKQLKKKKVVKIKFLKSITREKPMHNLALDLASLTGSELIHQIGSTVVLTEKKI